MLSDRAPVEMLRAHTQVHRHQNSAAPLHIHISTCMHFNYAFFRLGHPLRRRRDRGTAPDLCPSVCMVAATLPRRADRQSVGGARMYACTSRVQRRRAQCIAQWRARYFPESVERTRAEGARCTSDRRRAVRHARMQIEAQLGWRRRA